MKRKEGLTLLQSVTESLHANGAASETDSAAVKCAVERVYASKQAMSVAIGGI